MLIYIKNQDYQKYFIIYLKYKANYIFKITKITNIFLFFNSIKYVIYLKLKTCKYLLIYLTYKIYYIYKTKKVVNIF